MNKALVPVLIVIVAVIVVIEFGKGGVMGDANAEELALLDNSSRIAAKQGMYSPAVELVDPDGYINVDEGFRLQDIIGQKVVLVDFWTYSCINCQRTLPYLTAWDAQYRDDGLVIVGVHTPEFAFEEEYANVLRAVEKYGVEYPVVQDNDRQTWRAYQNRYWPRKYLIDIDGFIVYDHIGEGAYEETELKIRELLDERARVLGHDALESDMVDVDVAQPEFRQIQTPELYLGYDFARGQLGNREGWHPQEVVEYTLPPVREPNFFYLNGSWFNDADFMESRSNVSLVLEYGAREVNIVAGADAPVSVDVFVDGEFARSVVVDAFDLYTVVDLPQYGRHVVELRAGAGLQVYTFTFG